MGRDSPFMQSNEKAMWPQLSISSGKRPANSINVSIPTKRVRTASRSRFTGPTCFIHTPNRPDASSDDNKSFHDEHSYLHGIHVWQLDSDFQNYQNTKGSLEVKWLFANLIPMETMRLPIEEARMRKLDVNLKPLVITNLDDKEDYLRARSEKSGYHKRYALSGWTDFLHENGISIGVTISFRFIKVAFVLVMTKV